MRDFTFKIQSIESELYSIVNTIVNVNEKYQKGFINEFFFRKTIKMSMNNLLSLNFEIKKNNIMLSSLLKTMKFTDKYYNAINIINDISAFNTDSEEYYKNSNNLSKKRMRSSLLELPGITSEITSAFITLMDALSLDGLTDEELILRLFADLNRTINQFPGLNDIEQKILQIYNHCVSNLEILIHSKKYREKVANHLYQIFKEFQLKINLKP